MRSIVLQQFKKGYKNAAEQGYKQMSARPWLESEVITVLQHIEHQLKQRSGMIAALLAQPALFWLYFGKPKAGAAILAPGVWKISSCPQVSNLPFYL